MKTLEERIEEVKTEVQNAVNEVVKLYENAPINAVTRMRLINDLCIKLAKINNDHTISDYTVDCDEINLSSEPVCFGFHVVVKWWLHGIDDTYMHEIYLTNQNVKCNSEHKTSSDVPSFNEAAKMFDIVDAYLSSVRMKGWEWTDAIRFIQEHWNDSEFDVDYINQLGVDD